MNRLSRRYGQIAGKAQEHFVFLIDTSGSMRGGGVAKQFSSLHAELLDDLADDHPDSIVSCLTFNEECFTQYVGQPVESSPSLTMTAKFGTDLPVAICTGLHFLLMERLDCEDITVIVITDGDTRPHTRGSSQESARLEIDRMRASGVKFVLLAATDDLPSALESAAEIHIRPDEVMPWEHSEKSLREAFGKVGEMLALGGVKDAPPAYPVPCR